MQQSFNAALLISCHAPTLIAGFEGDRHEAYQDGNGVWTIGYGYTGPEVHEGLVWSEQEALRALAHSVMNAETDVLKLVTVPLTQNQFDALVSFDYNIGAGHLKTSTTLKKLNAGDYQGAADAMLMWVQPGSKNEAGLRKRREAERALFLTA